MLDQKGRCYSQNKTPVKCNWVEIFSGNGNILQVWRPLLSNLDGVSKKAKLDWTEELDLAFKRYKAIIVQDVLMSFPIHNTLLIFIYTDSSDYQLSACLMQNGKPVAYYSRKLSKSQKNYITMEKELLAVVMVLREFWSMLLGANINIYTDHKNLTFANFNTLWKLLSVSRICLPHLSG